MRIILLLIFILVTSSFRILHSAVIDINIDSLVDMQNIKSILITKSIKAYEAPDSSDIFSIIDINNRDTIIKIDLPENYSEYKFLFSPIDYESRLFCNNSDSIYINITQNNDTFFNVVIENGTSGKSFAKVEKIFSQSWQKYFYEPLNSYPIPNIKFELRTLLDSCINLLELELVKQKYCDLQIIEYFKNKFISKNYSLLSRLASNNYKSKKYDINPDSIYQLIFDNSPDLIEKFISNDVNRNQYISYIFSFYQYYYYRNIDSNYRSSFKENLKIISLLVPAVLRAYYITDLLYTSIVFTEYNQPQFREIMEYIEANQNTLNPKTLTYFERLISTKESVFSSKQLPLFEVETINGDSKNLKNIILQPTLLYFWATWCSPCIQSLKSIAEKKEILDKYGIKLVLISNDHSFSNWKNKVTNELNNYENYISRGGSQSPAGISLGINSIPFVLLVDSTGLILDFNTISLSDENFEAKIGQIMSKLK